MFTKLKSQAYVKYLKQLHIYITWRIILISKCLLSFATVGLLTCEVNKFEKEDEGAKHILISRKETNQYLWWSLCATDTFFGDILGRLGKGNILGDPGHGANQPGKTKEAY